MSEYLLPDVGEGLVEAEIVTWKVQVGDEIKINDVVVEIETAKSLVELPSPYAGTVEALLVEEGVTVAVGTPIIRINDGVAPAGAAPAAPARDIGEIDLSNPATSGGGEGESLVGRNKAERGPIRRARKGGASPRTEAGANTQLQLQGAFSPGLITTGEVAAVDEPVVPATPAPVPPPMVTSDHVALAKPPVRKLAKGLGVDLTTVTPTGSGGVITRADVEAAASGGYAIPGSGAAPAAVAVPAGERSWREPIKGVRKMMGQAMVFTGRTGR